MEKELTAPQRVEFKTKDGITLRGDFYKADGKNVGIAVMTAGFSLLKELNADTARAFQAAGISALAYDYRTFGSSDGMPRQEIDLYQQASDFQDAITAARLLPDVDPSKAVMWGIGHGGSAAMIAAGYDPRIKAAVFHAPFPSGAIDAAHYPDGVLERAWKDREVKTKTGDTTAAYQKVWRDWEDDKDGDGRTVFIQAQMGYYLSGMNIALAKAAGTPWENEVTLNSFINIASSEPKDHLYKITKPALYIVHDEDPFNVGPDVHQEFAATMGPNGEYKVIYPEAGKQFMDTLNSAVAYQVEWLTKVLNS